MMPFMRIDIAYDGDKSTAWIMPSEIEVMLTTKEGTCYIRMKSGAEMYALYTAETMEGMIAKYYKTIQEMMKKAQMASHNGIQIIN